MNTLTTTVANFQPIQLRDPALKGINVYDGNLGLLGKNLSGLKTSGSGK